MGLRSRVCPDEPEDSERFQSIFARNEGAVTAPTASLHFSRELMKAYMDAHVCSNVYTVQGGDYGVVRGAQKLNLSVEEFEKEMSAAGYQIPIEV